MAAVGGKSPFAPQVGVSATSGQQTSGADGVKATMVLPGTDSSPGFTSAPSAKPTSASHSLASSSGASGASRNNPGGGGDFNKKA